MYWDLLVLKGPFRELTACAKKALDLNCETNRQIALQAWVTFTQDHMQLHSLISYGWLDNFLTSNSGERLTVSLMKITEHMKSICFHDIVTKARGWSFCPL